VVALIKERFGYYHAQIFRHDPDRDVMEVIEGYGEVGEKLKAAGHSLPYGRGVVGRAAASGEPVLATDVTQDPNWVPHPALPGTKGELAVPIRLQDEVLGVLDVQSDVAGALGEGDQVLLMGLAGQIAAAIQSTRLFEQAQGALREMEATNRRYLQRAWTDYLQTGVATSYEIGRPDSAPLGARVLPEIRQAVQRREATVLSGDNDAAEPRSALVVPVALRGGIIGALGIHDDDGARQWTEEEIALAEAVVERMALAAENLRLLDETQRRASRERLVGEVATRMRESLEMEAMLRTAASEMRQALNLDDLVIRLATPGTDGEPAQDMARARVESRDRVEEGTDDAHED
jgi:GAF domain-containing protein